MIVTQTFSLIYMCMFCVYENPISIGLTLLFNSNIYIFPLIKTKIPFFFQK